MGSIQSVTHPEAMTAQECLQVVRVPSQIPYLSNRSVLDNNPRGRAIIFPFIILSPQVPRLLPSSAEVYK